MTGPLLWTTHWPLHLLSPRPTCPTLADVWYWSLFCASVLWKKYIHQKNYRKEECYLKFGHKWCCFCNAMLVILLFCVGECFLCCHPPSPPSPYIYFLTHYTYAHFQVTELGIYLWTHPDIKWYYIKNLQQIVDPLSTLRSVEISWVCTSYP